MLQASLTSRAKFLRSLCWALPGWVKVFATSRLLEREVLEDHDFGRHL